MTLSLGAGPLTMVRPFIDTWAGMLRAEASIITAMPTTRYHARRWGSFLHCSVLHFIHRMETFQLKAALNVLRARASFRPCNARARRYAFRHGGFTTVRQLATVWAGVLPTGDSIITASHHNSAAPLLATTRRHTRRSTAALPCDVLQAISCKEGFPPRHVTSTQWSRTGRKRPWYVSSPSRRSSKRTASSSVGLHSEQ